MKNYSQYEQDKYVYENFFNNKTNGVFVDVGADDGVRFSNTKLFEDLGWSGLCIEPRPEAFALLKENRNCILENCGILNKEGEFEFLNIKGYGKGLSGITDMYCNAHVQRIKGEAKYGKDDLIQVKCHLLQELLDNHQLKNIDYLSVDVEGAEESVIRSIDFAKTSIKVITIENNYNENGVSDFLYSIGYTKHTRLSIDDVFTKIEPS